MYYLVIGSSTKPALFHAGCRPTSCRSSPSTYIWPACQKGTPNTHIWSCSKLQSHEKGPALTFTSMIGHHITNICEMALHLYLTYSSEGHNPIQAGAISGTMMEDSQPSWNHICHNEERFLHLYLTYLSEGHNPIQEGATSNTMMEDSHPQWREISALTSDMEGTKSFSHEQNGTSLTSVLLDRMAQSHPGRSHLRHNDGRLSPTMRRDFCTYIWHGRN